MTFFLLVFGLSLPLWIVGGLLHVQLLPGVPLSSLMVVCPVTAAVLLSWKDDGRDGVVRVLRRSLDLSRIDRRLWYVPTFLLMPGIAIAAYGLMRLLRMELPGPQVAWGAVPGMLAMVILAALAEELGWSGYATDRLQKNMTALQAAALIGVVTGVWHVVPLLEVGRSVGWTAWQVLNIGAARVLLVWVYNNAGHSVTAAALCHASVNVSWQLFPNQGSHYDPRVVGLITVAVAILVSVVWGPKTMTRRRDTRRAGLAA
ncbi:MAG: CPBP family intramembrane metalloprotease [Gemmatimonadetes bacterium]|nr:CPBP family intramembrane metalloprotease [Gemmatimonadota bacterium]